jgi:prevent-host-death family protein
MVVLLWKDRRLKMTKSMSVAEAKSRFSELVNRASYGGERFLIERRGKAVGAIVSAADLARLEGEEAGPPRKGLLAAVGALAEFEEFDQILEEIQRQRATAYDREVNLE